MSFKKFNKWTGIAGIFSGLFVAVGFLLHPEHEISLLSTNMWIASHSILTLSLYLGLIGITGLFFSAEGNIFGFIGYICTFFAMCSFIGLTSFEAFYAPNLTEQAPRFLMGLMNNDIGGTLGILLPVTGILFTLGLVIFSLFLIRTKKYSSWSAWLLLIGAIPIGLNPLMPLIVIKLGAVLFGVGFMNLAYTLFSDTEMTGVEPNPADSFQRQ